MIDARPSLWRVAGTTLVVGLVANVFLIGVSATDDWFANIVGVASGVAAIALVVTAYLQAHYTFPVRRWACLLAFAVWTSNLIEFASEQGASIESKLRQCGFYLAFAILALGAYVSVVIEDRNRGR